MITDKLLESLQQINANGYGEITTSPYAAHRVHPGIARRLMKLGWAKYDVGGCGNTRVIILTDAGKREAKLADVRSEQNT